MNLRPSGYEPDELPGCSTPRKTEIRTYCAPDSGAAHKSCFDNRDEEAVLRRPGSDLLSQALRLSTIGAEEFDGRVRDGIGYRLLAITARPAKDRTEGRDQAPGFRRTPPPTSAQADLSSFGHGIKVGFPTPDFRPHEWALEMRAIKPIERLVPVSCTHYCASTPGLSTWWSTTALEGDLVSRWVSRLDAFSGYPVRT